MASSDSRFWHPFADMHAVRSAELAIVRGDGVHVSGRRTAAATSTAPRACGTSTSATAATEIADAAAAQMRELATLLGVRRVHQPARARSSPSASPRSRRSTTRGSSSASGGGDAIDTAAKLARRYFAAIGQPERVHLICRTQGYHGTHGLGTSIGGIPANRVDMGPLDPRRLAGAARLARGARGRDRARRRRPRGGRLRRAGDRRRRRAPAARRATSRASTRSASAPACCSSSTR